jgi:hypothetical protein
MDNPYMKLAMALLPIVFAISSAFGYAFSPEVKQVIVDNFPTLITSLTTIFSLTPSLQAGVAAERDRWGRLAELLEHALAARRSSSGG